MPNITVYVTKEVHKALMKRPDLNKSKIIVTALKKALAKPVKVIAIALLFLTFSLPCYASDDPYKWTPTDTALQVVFLTTLDIDRAQTAYGSKYRYEETGFARSYIGPHPSAGQVNGYFASCALLHTGIAYVLPKPYRTIWQSFFIGVEYNSIRHNINAGISVRF